MSLLRPNQPNFSGGEYSPNLYARVDIERYRTGLKKCRNFIPFPYGGVGSRPGFRYVATTRDSTLSNAVIVQEFVFSQEQTYILEFGGNYIRFYTGGVQAEVDVDTLDTWSVSTAYLRDSYVSHEAPTGTTLAYLALSDDTGSQPDSFPSVWAQQDEYEIYSPYALADITGLKFETSADVIYITHPDYEPRTLTRYGSLDWRLETYSPVDGPFMATNVESKSLRVSAVTGSTTMIASSSTFEIGHVNSLWKLTHYVASQTVTKSFSSSTTSSSASCFTTWRVISHGTWTGSFDVEKSSDGGSTWTTLRTFSSANDFNANTSGTEDIELNPVPFLVRINMTSYTSGTANIDLTTDAFFQDGIARVTAFNSSTNVDVTVLQDFAETGTTEDWAEGSWSDASGYPAVARFFQDRLFFANTYTQPQTLWGSVTGNYTSFKRNSILLDTDGITLNIPSRQVNEINGLMALTNLLIFTTASEWSLAPGTNGILSPASAILSPQGYRGSNGVTPTIVGNEMIYIQSNSKAVRNISFDFGSDSFTGSEVNILARHLFDNWNIIDLAYQQDPFSIIWALRSDGVLLGCTYLKEQNIAGWHWHDTGVVIANREEGALDKILSIAVVPNSSDNFDELWIAVVRTNGVFIERMSLRLRPTDCGGVKTLRLDDQIQMDSAVTFNTVSDMNQVLVAADGTTTISSSNHGFSDGNEIVFRNVSNYPTLNGRSFIITNSATNSFDLGTETT